MTVSNAEVVNLSVIPNQPGERALVTQRHERTQADPVADEAALHAGVLAVTEIQLNDLTDGPDVDLDTPDTDPDEDGEHDPADESMGNTSPTAADIAAMSGAERDIWDLVERAQAGDAEAFAQIYLRYRDTVERFAYFKTGNRQVAEDITSGVFMRALRRIGSVTWQGRDLSAWLITITKNLVFDHFKAGRTRFELTTEEPIGTETAAQGQGSDPEADALGHISNVELLQVVQKLPAEQRRCIILRFLMGYSVTETAKELGKNEGATKALQYRAVRALHRLLPEGFEP